MINTFFEASKKIANDFLQNIVFIDDKAFTNGERNNHEFNALQISQSFARSKKVCAVYKPETTSDIDNLILLAKKADITVIDWQIIIKEEVVKESSEEDAEEDDPRGPHTRRIIREILSDPITGKENLKLIIIYTGETRLYDITDDVFNELYEHGIEGVLKEDCIIKTNNVKILVIAKPSVDIKKEEKKFKHNPELKKKIVSYEDLPEFILTEFTKMTSGLLSNVILQSLIVIRNNTFRLINVYNKDLDPAFLSHRALLSNPEESQESLSDLIASEMLGLLKHSEVGQYVSMENIKNWLNSKDVRSLKKKMHLKKACDTLKELETILTKGIPNISPSRNKNVSWSKFLASLKNEDDKNKLSQLTNIFSDNDASEKLDMEFALIMSYQSSLVHYPPKLDQGTLLKCQGEHNSKYYVCIQPKCDCYRIKSSGEYFIFLLIKETTPTSPINLIVKEGDINKKFKLNNHPQFVEKFKFKSKKTDQPVIAEYIGSKWLFKGTSADNIDNNFEFLGYLKQDYSQRLVSNFANNLSRIGLSESEWLRRWAK